MTIATCPSCDRLYRVPSGKEGQLFRCPDEVCRTVIQAPDRDPDSADDLDPARSASVAHTLSAGLVGLAGLGLVLAGLWGSAVWATAVGGVLVGVVGSWAVEGTKRHAG